jgi:pimeloyl-ACP methyl ester carboxylesterase
VYLLFLSAGLGLASAAQAAGVVSCATFAAALRNTSQSSPFLTVMLNYSSTYQNTANGQTIRYLAVRPTNTNAGNYETLVFFNGTSQITPDWPVNLLAGNTTALCDNNALVFTDYPGVGGTAQPADTAFTFDNISYNVYNLLASLNDSQGFNIKSINPTGWSLGTESALKFAALATWNSGFSGRGMRINKLFLIAPKSGGDLLSNGAVTPSTCSTASPGPAPGTAYFDATGNQAMCVTTVFSQLLNLKTDLQWEAGTLLKATMVGLLFPTLDASGNPQGPYGPNDPADICAASLSSSGYDVSSLCDLQTSTSLATACTVSPSTCTAARSLFETNRSGSTNPYRADISYPQYLGERRLTFTFGYGSCSSASTASWQSTDCNFNPTQVHSDLYLPALVVNGSPCTTIETTDGGAPVVTDCAQFATRLGGILIFNGAQDMFIRHDYGTALCNWFNASGWAPCTVTTYNNAGHGVPFSYGTQINAAISGALARPPR